MCLSVTTITKKNCGWICTTFYAKIPKGKGKTKFVFRYGEVTVKTLRKPVIVYKIAPSGNYELAGRKIVHVEVLPSVGDKNTVAGICTLSENFPSSCQSNSMQCALLSLMLRSVLSSDKLQCHHIN